MLGKSQIKFRAMIDSLGNPDGLAMKGEGWIMFEKDTATMTIDRASPTSLILLTLACVILSVALLFTDKFWVAFLVPLAVYAFWRCSGKSYMVKLSEVVVIRRQGPQVSFSPYLDEDGFGSRPAIPIANTEKEAMEIEELLRAGEKAGRDKPG